MFTAQPDVRVYRPLVVPLTTGRWQRSTAALATRKQTNYMCAINPKFQRHFKLSFYTSHGEEEQFDSNVTERLLLLEQEFNKDGRIRVHVNELPPPRSTAAPPRRGNNP
jgi:hypothetical protein